VGEGEGGQLEAGRGVRRPGLHRKKGPPATTQPVTGKSRASRGKGTAFERRFDRKEGGRVEERARSPGGERSLIWWGGPWPKRRGSSKTGGGRARGRGVRIHLLIIRKREGENAPSKPAASREGKGLYAGTRHQKKS